MDKEFEYYTYQESRSGDYDIYGWGRYGRDSVLYGQPRKVFLGVAMTLAEAEARYPGIYNSHPAFEVRAQAPECPPDDWSPMDAGEHWHEDDY